MAKTSSDEQLAYALTDSIFILARVTNALVADVLAELELTTPLAYVLWRLDPSLPAPSMRQVAEWLRCDPSTVTFLADRLAKRKLVRREVDPANRRVKNLVLTDKGQKTRSKLTQAIARESPFARLSASERQQLSELLTKALALSGASSKYEPPSTEAVPRTRARRGHSVHAHRVPS
jgi:MarR family transcriptional regulator, organic hydroperoxide resistance regulator